MRAAQSSDGWMKRALHNRWLLRFAGLLVILALWEFMFSGGRINPIFSAPPSAVLKTVPEVLGDELYFPALFSTLRLFFLGFVIATVLGILLGLLLARVRLLDVGLSPYLNALVRLAAPRDHSDSDGHSWLHLPNETLDRGSSRHLSNTHQRSSGSHVR